MERISVEVEQRKSEEMLEVLESMERELIQKEYKENRGIYSESVKRRFRIWLNDTERVHWPVHGWAGKEKEVRKAQGAF